MTTETELFQLYSLRILWVGLLPLASLRRGNPDQGAEFVRGTGAALVATTTSNPSPLILLQGRDSWDRAPPKTHAYTHY